MAGTFGSKNLIYLLNALVDEETSALKTVLKAATAVTGTFWQAVQPVTGTFWQAVQPVSGVFWPATQPISDVINGVAIQADVSVSTTPIPLRVGIANQAGRKLLILVANGAGFTYGFSASVQNCALQSGTPVMLNIGENITVWAKKTTGTNTITVSELS